MSCTFFGLTGAAVWLIEQGHVSPDTHELINAAARSNAVDVIKAIIAKGGSTKHWSYFGRTPLAQAAARGHVQVVKLLLAEGNDPEEEDEDGTTPLEWCDDDDCDELIVAAIKAKGEK